MKPEVSSTLTFISQVISAVAWPITVFTCIFLLRKHLMALIPLVRTVKYSDVEIRFGEEIAELKKTAAISETVPAQGSAKSDQWETLTRLSEVRPRSAIRGAWNQVETSVRKLAKEKGAEVADAAEGMPMVIGAILLNQSFITSGQYELMQRLRVLFHEAERAEPDGITSDSASEYVALALRLAASIDADGR